MGQAVSLGEVPQHIDIAAQDDEQPVLLYLPGGPGRSATPRAHAYASTLERHFVVVHWDQRGTQRSYTDALEDFPLSHERLVADVLELSSLLSDWFDNERIVLVAEGTAALSALKAAQASPRSFYALVLLGPIVNAEAALAHSYQWALDEAYQREDKEALAALQPLGKPPWPEGRALEAYKTLNRWLDRLGGSVPGKDAAATLRALEESAPAGRRVRPELARRGEAYSLERLLPTLVSQKLGAQIPSIEVPLFFITGERDVRAPLEHVEAYYRELDARGGKTLVKLEGVGHFPLIEAPERVMEVLAGRVWPMAR